MNFLHEEGYIYLRDMESREPANLADVEYQTLEAKVTGKASGSLAAASQMKWLIWTVDGTGTQKTQHREGGQTAAGA